MARRSLSAKVNDWSYFGEDITQFAKSFLSLRAVKAEIALCRADLSHIGPRVPPCTPFEWWSLRLVQALGRQRYFLEAAEKEREAELAKVPAMAEMTITRERGDHGPLINCVTVTCLREEGGHSAGPIWGTHSQSVARALAQLSASCSCGARRHELS